MAEPSPRPRVSPLHREEIARIEVGHTAVRPGVARALVAFFLLAIAIVPVFETLGQRWTAAPATAWTRFTSLPGRVVDGYRADMTIGTPGRWNRTAAANRIALADMAAFEDALEDESLLGRSLRPGAQLVLSGALRAGNERVYIGRDGWLFFRPDTEYVTSAGFLDPGRLRRRIAGASEWATPPQPDPRIAIIDFHRQLEARGVTLIVMPTPVKPSVHPEQFAAAYGGRRAPLQNASYAEFIADLERAGVLVFDPAPTLAAGRLAGAQYLATDTHWRPEAMEAVAGSLAGLIRQHAALPDVAPPGFRIHERAVTNTGDTAAMLDLPAGQRLYPPEQAWLREVREADGGSMSASLSDTMPCARPTCIIDGIWNVLPSRIRLLMALLAMSTSSAATRPPPIFRHRCLCDHALQRLRQHDADLRLRSVGNWSMTRSTVEAAVVVCSVPNTRWPVSAVSIAIATVSRSRSSPTRTMSGSSRSAARSASLNERCGCADLALVDQAALVLVHELDRILDRDDVIGAGPVDVVDHRAERRGLARDPVGPVTSTRPLVRWHNCRMCCESPSCSAVRISAGITRNTAPRPLRSRKLLARKRARPAISYAKSVSCRRENSSRFFGGSVPGGRPPPCASAADTAGTWGRQAPHEGHS
jgi:hypothetical protein